MEQLTKIHLKIKKDAIISACVDLKRSFPNGETM